MSNPSQRIAERVVLALGLPLVGVFLAMLAAGALSLVLPSGVVENGFVIVVVPAGIAAAALLAPRALRFAGRYSQLRRFLSGVFGWVAAVGVARGLEFVGIVPDALSHLQHASQWQGITAMGHEATMLLCFYGTLGAGTFVALGRPTTEQEGPPNDALHTSSGVGTADAARR